MLHRWYKLNNLIELKNKKTMSRLKKLITVKVTIQDEEAYEVESRWSQETEEFCEKTANEIKKFINQFSK